LKSWSAAFEDEVPSLQAHAPLLTLFEGDTSEDAIAARLATAKVELEMQHENGFWTFILVNDVADEAKARLDKFLGLTQNG